MDVDAVESQATQPPKSIPPSPSWSWGPANWQEREAAPQDDNSDSSSARTEDFASPGDDDVEDMALVETVVREEDPRVDEDTTSGLDTNVSCYFIQST